MNQNFDKHFDRFQRMYNTPRGRIRLDVLSRDLEKIINDLGDKQLNILDAGSGTGRLSLELVKRGHSLTLCDISEKMLQGAREECKKLDITDKVTFTNTPLSQLPEKYAEGFDLVLCHALLEWMQDAAQSITYLKQLMAPGSALSLMFYNKNATILKSIMKGNFFNEDKTFNFGSKNNLTPPNPLLPDDVYGWLSENKLRVTDKTGVRIFYDHIEESQKKPEDYDKILKNELLFCKDDPFIAIARYVHVVCVTE